MSDRPRHAFALAPDRRSAVFTPSAAGPWSPGHCHGGAVAALVTYAVEAEPAPAPMQLARLTLELHRPVPTAEVEIELRVAREGRKLQMLDVRLNAAGAEVARASALRLRVADQALPEAPQPTVDVAGPEEGSGHDFPATGFGGLFTLTGVRGAFRQPGPASLWFRLDGALAEGAVRSPAAVACAVGDFANGASGVLPFDAWTFLNADLTVNLARPPEGEWILLDAETLLGGSGRALSRARLADRKGWFGHASQSVLLEPR